MLEREKSKDGRENDRIIKDESRVKGAPSPLSFISTGESISYNLKVNVHCTCMMKYHFRLPQNSLLCQQDTVQTEYSNLHVV